MDSFERNLTNKLYRHDCPSTLELGEFQLGMNVGIKAHVEVCPHCSAELAQLTEFMGETREEPVSLIDKVRVFFADLVNPPASALLEGAQPVLRGDETAGKPVMQLLQFGDYVVSLSLNEGMLIGDVAHKEGVLAFEGWSAQINDENGSVSVEVGPDGGFLIENLAEGSYDLVIQGDETEIQLTNLRI